MMIKFIWITKNFQNIKIIDWLKLINSKGFTCFCALNVCVFCFDLIDSLMVFIIRTKKIRYHEPMFIIVLIMVFLNIQTFFVIRLKRQRKKKKMMTLWHDDQIECLKNGKMIRWNSSNQLIYDIYCVDMIQSQVNIFSFYQTNKKKMKRKGNSALYKLKR